MSYQDIKTYLGGFHDDSVSSKMIYSTLSKTGLNVSKLGFGGSQLQYVFETSKEQEGIKAVIKAVKSGINYIDTAPYYGQGKAEVVLGKALKEIPRSTYYLATKVGRYGVDVRDKFDFSANRTLKSVEESFSRLGVDHIDLLQVHDIEFALDVNTIINETLPVLQNLKSAGKISYIGITSYSLSCLKEILEKSKVEIDTVLSYCRCTLFDDGLRKYIPFFKETNVGIINAAVLGMGLLTNSGPPDWHPADDSLKAICKEAAYYCEEHNVNIAKLGACYSLKQPDIQVHLIGMESEELVEKNLSSLHDGLTMYEETIMTGLEKFYKKASKTDWENKEVAAYRKELQLCGL